MVRLSLDTRNEAPILAVPTEESRVSDSEEVLHAAGRFGELSRFASLESHRYPATFVLRNCEVEGASVDMLGCCPRPMALDSTVELSRAPTKREVFRASLSV